MMKKILVLILLAIPFAAMASEPQNETPSPDGKFVAYTLDNDLYIRSTADSAITRISNDGTDLILNGYSSWVYYEEIFGRYTNYKAFWWSPDSKKIAYYRFDNTSVQLFPIYHIDGKDGFDLLTRYPTAGRENPEARIAIYDLEKESTTWADFENDSELYYGTPFWSDDSRSLFVQRIPRVQNTLDLFNVDIQTGQSKSVYHEESDTWVDWMEGMLFSTKGLYMVRSLSDGWQQIYYLSYDGKVFKPITSGENWDITLLDLNEKKKEILFTAQRDSHVHQCLYKVDARGRIKALTPPQYNARVTDWAADFSSFTAELTNYRTPPADALIDTASVPLKSLIYIDIEGSRVPGAIQLPKGFDPSKKYPAVMEIYGGPGNPYVRDVWRKPSAQKIWFWENGYIHVTVDSRVAGHNGRKGVDLSYRDFVTVPVSDFCQWGKYLLSLPYVDRLGVEGYSFGGTNTAMLVMTHPEIFCCGIAGGGVYDWMFYDSHYTERYMDTPQRNPEGYQRARVLNYVEQYDPDKAYLKLAAGTADDNVHYQNTLELIDALQKAGKQFDLMIYPNGYHGCRGQQAVHDNEADRIFWEKHLKR